MRVTGLVLEAAGVRVPVGSVCEVRSAGQPPVLAEVVGFNGDRAFLMPTGELHGLASGARVRAAPGAATRRRASAHENHPWRRSEDRGLHLPMGDGLLGRVVDAHGQPMDRAGPLRHVRTRADGAPPDQCDGPRPGAPAAGHRRARDQRAAHRRPRPAPGPVRRHRRRQVGAAGHDGALHRGRRHRRRPDRRTRPRGQGVHRGHPRRRGPGAQRRRRRAGRRAAAGAHAGRQLRHRDRRALPRPRPARAAADGQPDALRDGAARDRAGDRRAAGHQGLSAELSSPSCRSWSSAAATASPASARSPPSTPC